MRETTGEIDWDDIRSDYFASPLTVEQLCARHGISTSALYRRIRRDGWRKRNEAISAWGGEHRLPKTLLTRLRNSISRRIRMIEKRSHGTAVNETALESEREARAIGALVKALEQVMALEKRLLPVPAKKPVNDNEGEDAAWRSKLAERLGQLLGSRVDDGGIEPVVVTGSPRDGDELGGNGEAGPEAADRR